MLRCGPELEPSSFTLCRFVHDPIQKKGENSMRIVRNMIRCNHCEEVIESNHRHDYVTCKCGCCSVDGGHDYLRRRFKTSQADYTELSQWEEDGEDAE